MSLTRLRQQKLQFALRIGISVILLTAIYCTLDLRRLLDTLLTISWKNALTLAFLYTTGQLLSTIKWGVFVSAAGINRTFGQKIRAYFFGMFVNALPLGLGTVGGDVARALSLNPEHGERAAALASVVADRLHGLLVLLFIGAIAITLFRPEVLGFGAVFISIAGICGLSLFWFFGPPILMRFFPLGHKFSDTMAKVTSAFPRTPKRFLTATLISISFHTLQIFMHFVIAKALSAPLSLSFLFATVPLVNVASSLPITIMNGVGVREAMYTLLFVSSGVSKETAVAFGAVWVLTVTIVSIIGGLILTLDIKKSVVEGSIQKWSFHRAFKDVNVQNELDDVPVVKKSY